MKFSINKQKPVMMSVICRGFVLLLVLGLSVIPAVAQQSGVAKAATGDSELTATADSAEAPPLIQADDAQAADATADDASAAPAQRLMPASLLSGNSPAIPRPEGAVLLTTKGGIDETGVLIASMAGDWEFALEADLEAAGLRNVSDITRKAWPTDTRHELEVPGCFTAQLPGLNNFVGAGWYRIWLDLKPPAESPADVAHADEWDEWYSPETVYAFDFTGIARESTLYINGAQERDTFNFSYVGRAIFLNPALFKDGPVAIAIRVSNELPEVGIPDDQWDGWWNHAGIFRPAQVLGFPHQTFFGPMRTRSVLRNRAAGPAGGWTFTVSPMVAEAGALQGYLRRDDLWVEAELAFPNKNAEGDDATSRTFRASGPISREQSGLVFQLPGDLPAWSPDTPVMGELRVVLKRLDGLVYSRRHVPVGLRDVALSGSQILLNGEPLKLFGFSYHEVDPETGYTFSDERLRADLTKIKAMGANFIRSGHYPPHPTLPNLADELGLIVWEEIPAWKTRVENLNDPHVRQRHLVPYLARMILRDINHPSVLFWSIGNEFDSSDPAIRDYVRWASNFARMNDSSRLIVYASDRRLDDVALDLVDVIAINEYYGWYYDEPADIGPVLDELHRRYPNKAILVSEFGAGAVLGQMERTPGARRDYSEPGQAKFLRQHIEQIFAPERAGYMAGAALWLWADFDDPHRTEKHHPKEWHGVNTKGVVTRTGEEKQSYHMLKKMIPEILNN